MAGTILFVLFFVLFFGYVAYIVYRSLVTLRFIKTDGWVISAEMEVDRDDDGVEYRPKIEYEYIVNGETYVNVVYSISPARGRRKVQKILDENPTGKTVQVFYNPNKPQDSVLEKGLHAGQIISIIIMAGLLLFAIIQHFS